MTQSSSWDHHTSPSFCSLLYNFNATSRSRSSSSSRRGTSRRLIPTRRPTRNDRLKILNLGSREVEILGALALVVEGDVGRVAGRVGDGVGGEGPGEDDVAAGVETSAVPLAAAFAEGVEDPVGCVYGCTGADGVFGTGVGGGGLVAANGEQALVGCCSQDKVSCLYVPGNPGRYGHSITVGIGDSERIV